MLHESHPYYIDRRSADRTECGLYYHDKGVETRLGIQLCKKRLQEE